MPASPADLSRDPRYSDALISPLIPRYLSIVARERGLDPATLCRGLGFTIEDLLAPDFRISYRQGSLMIQRGLQLVGDTGLGLAVGTRQTPVSWGLVGFGMLASSSLGEAMTLGLRFQRSSGALMHFDQETLGRNIALTALAQFHNPEIEVFLIEESFSSIVNMARSLVGAPYAPSAVELAYRRPAHAANYDAVFRCPVRFGCQRSRLVTDERWFSHSIATYDPWVGHSVRVLIERDLAAEQRKLDLSVTIERAIRDNLRAVPSLQDIAGTLNISERTLRRRLDDAGFSYQGLLEAVRKSYALELLSHSKLPLAEVADAVGFQDVRNFRRAFKRWTGITPAEARK